MQFCLIASLIACVHRKVCSLSKASGSCHLLQNSHINYKFNLDLHNSLCIHGHDFMWITEVKNRNAHNVLKYTIYKAVNLQNLMN